MGDERGEPHARSARAANDIDSRDWVKSETNPLTVGNPPCYKPRPHPLSCLGVEVACSVALLRSAESLLAHLPMPHSLLLTGDRSRAARLARVIGTLALLAWMPVAGATETPGAYSGVEAAVRTRLAAEPENATAWRLLSRLRLKAGDLGGARAAIERSLELNPASAAAHFDYGSVLAAAGELTNAAAQFQHCLSLAPDSEYAAEAQELLAHLPEPAGSSEVVQAWYEIRRFDGSERGERPEDVSRLPIEPEQSLFLRLETGVLYNTNVALAPTQRDLPAEQRESWQGFAAPALEYRWLSRDAWAAGPTFRGYFNLNEGPFRSLSLQSYQPGFFVERALGGDTYDLVPRLQYDFTHDEFDGLTFGQRHALTASAATYWHSGESSLAYVSVNHSDFVDDGFFPSLTSRDGWTWAAGASHTFFPGPLPFRAGVDVEHADTDGSDFRYYGVSLYGETVIALDETLWLILQGGWGYRDYPDFELNPSRNEHIWRAAARLEKQLSAQWIVAAVSSLDRFESRNDAFDAERTIGGLITVFEY